MQRNIRHLKYLINKTQNRTKILSLLLDSSHNPHQLSKKLKIEYKTVLHHLKVLKENGVLLEKKEGKRINLYEIKDELKNDVENLINGKNGIGIAIVNKDLKIEYTNNAIRDLLKLNGVGNLEEALNPKISNSLNQVLKNGKEVKIKDNGRELSIVPIKDKKERINTIILISQY